MLVMNKDLKKGDKITTEYGDFNCFVTCTLLEDAREHGSMTELVTDLSGETKMYGFPKDKTNVISTNKSNIL